MLILPITHKENQPNFYAMKLKRKNPHITDDIRLLAEKATDLIENIDGKKINVDGINVGDSTKADRSFRLSKVIDNNDVTLSVTKDTYVEGTSLNLYINNPRSKYLKNILYESHTDYDTYEYSIKRGLQHKWGEYFANFRCRKNGIRIKNARKPYSREEAQKLFIKYVEELLKPAEKIKDLFK